MQEMSAPRTRSVQVLPPSALWQGRQFAAMKSSLGLSGLTAMFLGVLSPVEPFWASPGRGGIGREVGRDHVDGLPALAAVVGAEEAPVQPSAPITKTSSGSAGLTATSCSVAFLGKPCERSCHVLPLSVDLRSPSLKNTV